MTDAGSNVLHCGTMWFKKSGKCFPWNTRGIVSICIILSLGMVPACSPWTGVRCTACSIHIWWKVLSLQLVLPKCFGKCPLCAHLKCWVRSALYLLHSLPKTTHWTSLSMAWELSAINMLCKIQGISFNQTVNLKYSSSCVYKQRRKNLLSNETINEACCMVCVSPNASLSGIRGVKGCWSLMWVNFRHQRSTILL